MMNRNIVLFGFMGCGMSTVGAELSANTGRELVDTDKLIEQREGMTVSQIINMSSEAINRMSTRDLSRAVRTISLAANKRLTRLENTINTNSKNTYNDTNYYMV